MKKNNPLINQQTKEYEFGEFAHRAIKIKLNSINSSKRFIEKSETEIKWNPF